MGRSSFPSSLDEAYSSDPIRSLSFYNSVSLFYLVRKLNLPLIWLTSPSTTQSHSISSILLLILCALVGTLVYEQPMPAIRLVVGLPLLGELLSPLIFLVWYGEWGIFLKWIRRLMSELIKKKEGCNWNWKGVLKKPFLLIQWAYSLVFPVIMDALFCLHFWRTRSFRRLDPAVGFPY